VEAQLLYLAGGNHSSALCKLHQGCRVKGLWVESDFFVWHRLQTSN